MPAEFLQGLKRLCEEYGILLVDDEVQAGIGRTGRVWGIEHSGVQPDLVVSGGSLGGGLPLSAVTGRSELMDSVTGGGLGGTFGGNPASCAAAEVVLDSIADRTTMAWANETGRIMWKHAATWSERFDLIGDVRGLGPCSELNWCVTAIRRRLIQQRRRTLFLGHAKVDSLSTTAVLSEASFAYSPQSR